MSPSERLYSQRVASTPGLDPSIAASESSTFDSSSLLPIAHNLGVPPPQVFSYIPLNQLTHTIYQQDTVKVPGFYSATIRTPTGRPNDINGVPAVTADAAAHVHDHLHPHAIVDADFDVTASPLDPAVPSKITSSSLTPDLDAVSTKESTHARRHPVWASRTHELPVANTNHEATSSPTATAFSDWFFRLLLCLSDT
ncbi:hypothetical protein H0H81_009551, partial [Sphagnurus paluster]